MIRPKMPAFVSIEGNPQHFFVGQVIHMDTGEILSFEKLVGQLATKDLVFIGEVHDNPEHHLIQVQILQALMAQNGPLTVAMEFFQKPQQPYIDRYMAGESTETAFLNDVDWKRQWSFDYSFYRPLMLAVKQKQGKVLAINAPNDIVRKVARSGLGGLAPEERALLAEGIDLGNEDHRAYLMEVFKYIAHGELKDFGYFYEAQCVWEDTMAENIAEAIKNTKQTMIVFSGNGHIINRFGIPDRTADRIPVDMATVVLLPVEEDGQTITRKTADYVWLTGQYSQRRSFHHPRQHGQKMN